MRHSYAQSVHVLARAGSFRRGEGGRTARLTVTLDARNPRPDLAPYVAGMLAKVTVLQLDRSPEISLTERWASCIKLIGWNEAACAARGESDPDETLEELSIMRREVGAERVEALLIEGASLDHSTAIELMRAL